MPKILINETDLTTPGTPGRYDNYAVLIPGFAAEAAIEEATQTKQAPDSNNAYLFKSAQNFLDTIGSVDVTITRPGPDNINVSLDHYGNKMAYELLKAGYPVIYKSLGRVEDYEKMADIIKALTDEKMWEPFKDKANYDFRFVTHGLLNSNSEMSAVPELQIEHNLIENGLAALANIERNYAPTDSTTDQEAEKTAYLNSEYEKIKTVYSIFIKVEGTEETSPVYYSTWEEASTILSTRKSSLERSINEEIQNGSYFLTEHLNIINKNIAALAEYTAKEDLTNRDVPGRGDCIALIELDENIYVTESDPIAAIIEGIDEMSDINAANGKYCALTVPSVYYKAASTDKSSVSTLKMPPAFHYLMCFINSLRLGFAEWYAAAGYTRGVSSYTIDHTSVKLGEVALNALEPRCIIDQSADPKFACNVIANFRGSYYLWGNRTAHPLGQKGDLVTGDLVASSFLNIRQLCITIKKQLYVACRTFTFDPNSDTLWVNFVNAIRPTLEKMKSDQGIRDYKIVKLYNDSKASLKARIRIIPIEAVEDFDLEVSLEDSFGETTAIITD